MPIDPSPRSAAAPARAARVFTVARPMMSGDDIRAFQDLLNRRLATWRIDLRVEEDGVYGWRTRDAAHRVLCALGVAPADLALGITPSLRGLVRRPPLEPARTSPSHCIAVA